MPGVAGPDQVLHAVHTAHQLSGGLDVVFANAGIGNQGNTLTLQAMKGGLAEQLEGPTLSDSHSICSLLLQVTLLIKILPSSKRL